MNRKLSSYLHFKARSKNKNKNRKSVDWIAAALIFLGALLFYCVIFPASSGLWGQQCARFLGWFAGTGRFFIPLLIGLAGFRIIINRGISPSSVKWLLSAVLFWSLMIFFTILGDAVWKENYGGILGLTGAEFFERLFGQIGCWIIAVGLICVLTLILSGTTPGEVFYKIWDVLVEDWQEWRKGRTKTVKDKKSPVVKPSPVLSEPLRSTSTPKIISTKEQLDPVHKNSEKSPIKIKEKPRKENASKTSLTTKASPETPPPAKIPYAPPSLEIFDVPEGGTPVPKEELTQRARHLEQTLGNFNIAASVVEIHPGPVITRYDLEPAPGVKVSSIASRSDDLALAMKSIGIRVLAPIPGKGAVGVEIPNSSPEVVGLQELMGRPEFSNHKSPLAFVLGKTVSGEPYNVDLAGLPHILIAGATGSGKSVVVHSLLCSILYRMPPEKVKFVLIDPKRLELPSYSMIPHLYDPLHPPMQAQVITNSKQASKALARLVKVMEHRYDQFAKANVRNIDSYNRKMRAEGKPEQYFLVVVIDELADLMLTSPKEVEDSIQRLAQMARAVGIHLVLATQRPSVDVITGVIKANLPARLALRVASAIDSRVIVDTVGAEVLLGKGDMLYLPPASPEPLRIQGAYVSEKEVDKFVGHLKKFGPPSYEDLFSSGSVLEFAVEDKKEMKDLLEALKLVLERKRVSQDLLKAHFGSSARATNLLSLLEMKEFIRKPEGSNRWEINFEMIEDFLEKAGHIPEGEMVS